MTTLKVFEPRQRFLKSVEHFWRYRIFAGTVYKLKVAKFQMFSMSKVFTLALQKQNTCEPETFHPKAHTKHFRAEAKIKNIYWIPLEIWNFFWHSEKVESGKISNVFDAQSFRLAIAKVKYLRIWNFPPKCPLSTSSSWGKYFENRLNTFGDMGFFLAQCTVWNSQNFKCCRCAEFYITLPLQKVKHLRTWNIQPNCPPSLETSSISGKDFEDRLNTFGGVWFLQPQCTSWKWQNFKCCQWAKFSPFHCKSKIPAHRKLSTQMPTLNIFELRQRFRKSVEYFWRYRIFAGTV